MSLAGLFEEINKVREGQAVLAQQLAQKKAQIKQVEESTAAASEQRRAFEAELTAMLRQIWALEEAKASSDVSLRLQKQQNQTARAHFDALVKTVAQITTRNDQARESLMVKLADVQRAPFAMDYMAVDGAIDLDSQRANLEQIKADSAALSEAQAERAAWEQRLLDAESQSDNLEKKFTDLQATFSDEKPNAELEQEKLSLERAVLEQNYIVKHLATQQKENNALEEKRQKLKQLEDELDDEIVSCQHQHDRLLNGSSGFGPRNTGAAFGSNKSQRRN